jgi:hypothetical protein
VSIAILLPLIEFDIVEANIVDRFFNLFEPSTSETIPLINQHYNMTLNYPVEWENKTQGWVKIPHQVSKLFNNNILLDLEKNRDNHSKGFVKVQLEAYELKTDPDLKHLARSELNKVKTLSGFSFTDRENIISDNEVWLIDYKSTIHNGSKTVFINENNGFVFSIETINSNIKLYREEIVNIIESIRFE